MARGVVPMEERSSGHAIIVHPRWPLPVSVPATFSDLPVEIVHRVASFMGPQDLLRFEQVNKKCKHASEDDLFWKNMLQQEFGWSPDKAPPSWRMMYRLQSEFFHAVILKRASVVMASTAGMPTIPRLFMPPILGVGAV